MSFSKLVKLPDVATIDEEPDLIQRPATTLNGPTSVFINKAMTAQGRSQLIRAFDEYVDQLREADDQRFLDLATALRSPPFTSDIKRVFEDNLQDHLATSVDYERLYRKCFPGMYGYSIEGSS